MMAKEETEIHVSVLKPVLVVQPNRVSAMKLPQLESDAGPDIVVEREEFLP